MTDAPAKLNPEKVAPEREQYFRNGNPKETLLVVREQLQYLFVEHDKTTAQLAEARAALEDWENSEAECCPEDFGFPEYIKNITAERNRLKRDLAAVTGELEAMNANHRVMAGELAEMGRERDKLNHAIRKLVADRIALSTPAPCGVEGHTMAMWVAAKPMLPPSGWR